MTSDEDAVQLEIIKSTGSSLLPGSSFLIFREKLAAYINELINLDFTKLVSWLYRLDVSEKKLKQSIASNTDAGLIIADLIIERQLQKLKSRRDFSQRADDIGDEEKW